MYDFLIWVGIGAAAFAIELVADGTRKVSEIVSLKQVLFIAGIAVLLGPIAMLFEAAVLLNDRYSFVVIKNHEEDE